MKEKRCCTPIEFYFILFYSYTYISHISNKEFYLFLGDNITVKKNTLVEQFYYFKIIILKRPYKSVAFVTNSFVP